MGLDLDLIVDQADTARAMMMPMSTNLPKGVPGMVQFAI